MSVHPFKWKSTYLEVLDQRFLPGKVVKIICRTPHDVAKAIKNMAVRGAPAIGCVAAYGIALAAKNRESRVVSRKSIKEVKNLISLSTHDFRLSTLEKAAGLLKSARPTAVNLTWAVDRMLDSINAHLPRAGPSGSPSLQKDLFSLLVRQAKEIEDEDLRMNLAIGKIGSRLFRKGKNVVLTHCNAGALATAGHGTALGIIRTLARRRKIKKVFVDETRPYLQGARLTAWELAEEKIPHELITDNMAAHFMKTEKIDAVIVGCDRVAANGDTANKIGTYNLAVLAKFHKVPFYVAMPSSTLDLETRTGQDIVIEERSAEEVVFMGDVRIAPKGTRARHPAFDVTPAGLITAFVTAQGLVRPPYLKNLKRLLSRSAE